MAKFVGILSLLVSGPGLVVAVREFRQQSPAMESDDLAKPDTERRGYVNTFAATNRSPPWNPHLCTPPGLAATRVHYRPFDSVRSPASMRAHDTGAGVACSGKVERLYQVFGAVTRRGQSNVHVLLGDPASGKSSLSVQLAQIATDRWSRDRHQPVPVYIDLAYFDHRYSPTCEGFESLVAFAISEGLPEAHQPGPGTGRAVRVDGDRADEPGIAR